MGKLGYIVRCIAHMDYGALFQTVGDCHDKSGKNRVWLFADVVKCGFKFGAGYKDYSLLEFYNMNDAQRSTFVTRGVNNTIVRRLNNPEYYHLVDNKNEFYSERVLMLKRKFIEYLKRNGCGVKACTINSEHNALSYSENYGLILKFMMM